MRAAVEARFRPRFHPKPARGAAFVASPCLPLERARRRRNVKVAFSARHLAGTGVPRYFQQIGCTFAVRAIGPRARQLPVFVTMFGATLHHVLIMRENPPMDNTPTRPSDYPFSVRALAYIAAGHVIHHVRILKERYL
jgi:hypothetical protein